MSELSPLPPIQMKKDDDEGESRAIGEQTPIRLGLILAVLGVVSAGIIGSAVWVATQLTELKGSVSAMQSTLNTLAVASSVIRDDVANHKTDDSKAWAEIRGRVLLLEQSGSQATRDLSKELNELRNDFRVHEALSKQPKGPP